MAEVVVFGVVAVDVVLRVPTVPGPGEQVSGQGLGWRVGGSSANVACGLASAGYAVRLVGPVGDDAMADELTVELRRWGVDTSEVFRLPGPSPRTLLLLDSRGERSIIGLDEEVVGWRFMPDDPPDLSSAACVYVESYTRYPTSIATAAESALLVTSPPVAGAIAWPADVVVGSAAQYSEAALADPYSAMRALAGPRLRWVVVTRAERGADAYGPDTEVHAAAPDVSQVDATGAGDAFAAGLVHALLRGSEVAEALELAVRWGAEAVTGLRSLPPTWAELLAAPHGASLQE